MQVTIYIKTQDLVDRNLLEMVQTLGKNGIVRLAEKSGKTYINFDLLTPKVKKIRKEKHSTEIVVSDEKKQYPKLAKDGSISIVEGNDNSIIAEMMYRFQKVNKNFAEFYTRRAYRNALQHVVSNYDLVLIFKILDNLHETNAIPYAPIITNPIELKNRLPHLIAFIQRKKKEESSRFKTSI